MELFMSPTNYEIIGTFLYYLEIMFVDPFPSLDYAP